MCKILVVDDDQDLTRALSVRLQTEGFDVVCCADAENALNAVKLGDLQAILVDLDRPNFPGPQFRWNVGHAEQLKHVPVIYLSVHDTIENRRVAWQLGAAAFLTKPYDPVKLIETVRSVIGLASR